MPFQAQCAKCKKKITVNAEPSLELLREQLLCLECKGIAVSKVDGDALSAAQKRAANVQFAPRLAAKFDGYGHGVKLCRKDLQEKRSAEQQWYAENRDKVEKGRIPHQREVLTENGAGILPDTRRGRKPKESSTPATPAKVEAPAFGTPAALTASEQKMNALRKRMENDLYFLAKEVVGWDKEYLDDVFHAEACAQLDEWFRKYQYIIMHWPREHLKTTLITVTGSVQEILRTRAEITIGIGNANENNACDMLGQIAGVFRSNEIIHLLYPDIIPDNFDDTVWRTDAMLLKRKGTWKEKTVEAFGAGTDITGRHYRLGILDDIVSFKNSRTPAERAYIRAWYKQFLSVQGAQGRIWIPSTRYHNDDLYGHLKKTGNYAISFYTCYKGAKQSGEPLYKRFTGESLNRIKKEQGNFVFSCQYLNKAVPDDEVVFKEQFESRFKDLPENVTHYLLVDQVNPEVKNEADTKDRAVVLDVAVGPDTHWYVNDYICKRMQPSELIDHVVRMMWLYKPVRVGIGAVGYERTIRHDIREVEQRRGIYIPFEMVPNANRAKSERIMALEPKWSRTEIHFRDWMEDFLDEITMFPGGTTDDIIDSLALLPDVLVSVAGGSGASDLGDVEYEPVEDAVNY